MMNVQSKLSALALMAMLFFAPFALTSCQNEGPVEEAGEEVDEAVGEVKDSAEEASEEVDEAVDEVKDSAEEAGEEIEDEYDEATN